MSTESPHQRRTPDGLTLAVYCSRGTQDFRCVSLSPATPTSRTTRSDSSGPKAPPAAGSPISPRASAATRGPPR